MSQLLLNPLYRQEFVAAAPDPEPRYFHRRWPGYAPTPLHPLPQLAERIGVAGVLAKFEGQRLGLPAYKVLGALWATYRLIEQRAAGSLGAWRTLEELQDRLRVLAPLTLVTASDGNHGRGVARVARLLGFQSRIYLPAGTVAARIEAIAGEGAEVVVVEGTYDETVARAAADASPEQLLIQDHGWPGYEAIPALISDGYSTLFWEIDEALGADGGGEADLVVVPIGVGTLAAAAVRHYRRPGITPPRLLGVEPVSAACALASAAAGAPVTLEARAGCSIMAGLVCGTPSSAAWPLLAAGFNAFAAIEDEHAIEAMRALAAEGLAAGESGAAGVGALLALLEGTGAETMRERLGLTSRSRVVVLVTEGVTDPAAYRRLVGSVLGDDQIR
jgi:diaminopropionate ammonia-lyase